MLYLVSYDLTGEPEKEYEALFAFLKELGAVRVLYSEWLLATDSSGMELLGAVKQHVKDKDYVWVLEVTKNSAWHRVRGGDSGPAKRLFAHAIRGSLK